MGVEEDELYGLPLERFVPERTALVKSLRADGRREDAARVVKFRKPSVAAWAVNQLVRTQGRAVGELFAAGDALVQAHAAVVSGTGDARSLRDAAARERAAADALLGAARGLLTADGHELGPAIIDRVADTLRAAALEEDARAEVREGRLERELRHVGLGGERLATVMPPAAARAQPARPAPPPGARPPVAPGARPPPERPRRELAAIRKAARAAEAEARRRAERAERALQNAIRVRDRAAEQLRDAEEALTQSEQAIDRAEAEARTTAEAHRKATHDLERLDG